MTWYHVDITDNEQVLVPSCKYGNKMRVFKNTRSLWLYYPCYYAIKRLYGIEPCFDFKDLKWLLVKLLNRKNPYGVKNTIGYKLCLWKVCYIYFLFTLCDTYFDSFLHLYFRRLPRLHTHMMKFLLRNFRFVI